MDGRILKKIELIVSAQHVHSSPASLIAYSYDATPNFQSLPDVVVAPSNVQEVQSLVLLCAQEGIPIVPRGSGTNLAAGTTPTSGGLVMLFHRMNNILELDEENLTIRVQPGVITEHIHNIVEDSGLFYPPDPSSMKISTIGGNVSENSGGLRGLKYGVTKNYVLGLEVVLANGDIMRTGGKLAKDVAGYDVTSLFVGAEGTLGIVTEILLKLIPLPETKQTMVAIFPSLEEAGSAVSAIISEKITPVTLEFMDNGTIRAVEAHAKIGLPVDAEALLLLEQDGPAGQVQRDMKLMSDVCKKFGAVSVQLAQNDVEAEQLRLARRTALSALARLRPTTILEDATVPRSEIASMVREIQRIAQKHNVLISTFGHAGDGNLHPTCLTDVRNVEEMQRVEAAFAEIFEVAIGLGGTITGEHGVGEMKAPYLEWKIGAPGIQVMKSIKTAFDPQNIMNPGKIFAKETKKRVVLAHG